MRTPRAKGTQGLTPTDTPSSEEIPALIRLMATEGPGKGASALLGESPLVLGSGEDCGLQIRDGSVSRHHVVVEWAHGQVQVRDLGSKNGTRYLNARIAQAAVPLGGAVRLGRTLVTFLPL